MNIGIVLSQAPQYSETFFLNKIKGLKECGFNVILYAQFADTQFSLCEVALLPPIKGKSKSAQFTKLTFVLLRFLIFYPVRFMKFVRLERTFNRSWLQIIKNIYTNSHILKADLDWLHFGFATIAIQSEHVAKAIGAKMAVSFRGYDIDVYPQKHPHCYDMLWKQVDKVHTISDYLLQKSYGLGLQKTSRYELIYPAIDVTKFEAQTKKKGTEILQFLTVARLERIKGLNYSIEAMAQLKSEGVVFNYTIIGDGSEYEVLKAQIQQLGVSDCVFLIGKQTTNIIIDYMETCSIYIQYSNSEGFCNSLLEAQAMGLLCIASDGGGLPENVLHEQTGWIVPKKDPKLLAHTIMDVILLPDTVKKQISYAAQMRVKKDFNLDKQKQLFKDFYETNNFIKLNGHI